MRWETVADTDKILCYELFYVPINKNNYKCNIQQTRIFLTDVSFKVKKKIINQIFLNFRHVCTNSIFLDFKNQKNQKKKINENLKNIF